MEEKTKSVSESFSNILPLSPEIVGPFMPSNALEQKTWFLEDAITNPAHVYDRLGSIDFDAKQEVIERMGSDLLACTDMNPKYEDAYHEFIKTFQTRTRFLKVAADLRNATDPGLRLQLEAEYMRLNIELFGEPDENTYRYLLQIKLQAIESKALTGRALAIKDELFRMADYDPAAEMAEVYSPSDETVAWMHDVVMGLYSGMLNRIPDQETFSATEISAVFEDIIRNEFGESAEEWQVVIEKASSVNVKAYEKRIVIPENKNDVPYERVRELVVHELGVHMLRAVMGEGTDLPLLRVGLGGSGDVEEGLGLIMEQALAGKAKTGGANHYITAGAAYFDKMDFRGVFEMNWRIKLLEKLESGSADITQGDIQEARQTAYDGVMRIFRGTDRLPWFKDLSYYNGPNKMWRYLESMRGDDIKFMFVLLGKTDPTDITQQRTLYETSSV